MLSNLNCLRGLKLSKVNNKEDIPRELWSKVTRSDSQKETLGFGNKKWEFFKDFILFFDGGEIENEKGKEWTVENNCRYRKFELIKIVIGVYGYLHIALVKYY